MKVTVLVDDLARECKYEKRHGLCLYIETESKKILFDLGPNDTFIRNAKRMDIDLKEVLLLYHMGIEIMAEDWKVFLI